MKNQEYDASASIGACEFHKKTQITTNQRKTEEAFRKKFIDSLTSKVKAEFVTHRCCPLCGRDNNELIFVKNGFDHVHCKCEMIYVPSILKDENMNLVYADQKHQKKTHDEFRREPRKSYIQAIYQKGIELLKDNKITSGLLLDIGCSSGLFIEYAKARGFQVKGIEPSHYAVKIGLSRKLDISQGYFQKGLLEKESVDIITLWDVLEHCESVDVILDAAYESLVPGGAIFLQVPNVMGLAPRIMQENCNMFTGFGHINLFGPKTIEKALKKHNFARIKMQSVISEISVINNYLNYHDPYYGSSIDRDNILGLIDINALHKNLLGYKLQVIAKK